MNDIKIGDVRGCRKLLNIFYDKKRYRKMAAVECIYCKSIKNMDLSDFIKGKNISCHCVNKKHGMNRTKIYSIYANMKYRCYNQNHHEFHNYGGKGICMCEEWVGDNGFINFYKWALENGYEEGLTIDRINSDGDYCPENCQWITRSENTIKANKTKQHRKADNGTYYAIDQNGNYYEFDNAAQFGREHGIKPAKIRNIANGVAKTCREEWRFGFINEIQ